MDTVFLALRVLVSLGAVFGALWFAHRWVTKGRPGVRLQRKAIAVAARQGLGAKAGIAIVEADGRRYLLGVTEHAVTVLDRLDAAPPEGQQQTQTTLAVVATGPVPAIPGVTAETRIVSVVTTGPVPAVRPTFEQQLAAVGVSFTDTISLPAQTDPPRPAPEVIRIDPGQLGDQPLTRRAARAAENARATGPARADAPDRSDGAARPSSSPLAGSILSPDTWRQTVAALKRTR